MCYVTLTYLLINIVHLFFPLGMKPPSSSVVMMIVNRLTSQRLVLTEHSRNDILMRLRLNISTDDVSYALQSVPDGS